MKNRLSRIETAASSPISVKNARAAALWSWGPFLSLLAYMAFSGRPVALFIFVAAAVYPLFLTAHYLPLVLLARMAKRSLAHGGRKYGLIFKFSALADAGRTTDLLLGFESRQGVPVLVIKRVVMERIPKWLQTLYVVLFQPFLHEAVHNWGVGPEILPYMIQPLGTVAFVLTSLNLLPLWFGLPLFLFIVIKFTGYFFVQKSSFPAVANGGGVDKVAGLAPSEIFGRPEAAPRRIVKDTFGLTYYFFTSNGHGRYVTVWPGRARLAKSVGVATGQ